MCLVLVLHLIPDCINGGHGIITCAETPDASVLHAKHGGIFFAMALLLKGYPIARQEINRDIVNSYRKKRSLDRLLTLAVDRHKKAW